MVITWNNANILWNSNSFTWDDVKLVQEIISGGGNIEDDMPWMKPEKKKQLIKLILKVKGETLTDSKQKSIKQYKINKNGDIINGLYAVGEMLGGLWHNNYPSGGGMMAGAVFGKNAGKHASNKAI